MLVLSRKSQEAIVIRDDIVVRVLEVGRDVVKLGIEAPAGISVHRVEAHSGGSPDHKRRHISKQGNFRKKSGRS